jgi:predicted hotdog family 3-hydroxylacyl-ACP dehydratase
MQIDSAVVCACRSIPAAFLSASLGRENAPFYVDLADTAMNLAHAAVHEQQNYRSLRSGFPLSRFSNYHTHRHKIFMKHSFFHTRMKNKNEITLFRFTATTKTTSSNFAPAAITTAPHSNMSLWTLSSQHASSHGSPARACLSSRRRRVVEICCTARPKELPIARRRVASLDEASCTVVKTTSAPPCIQYPARGTSRFACVSDVKQD